MKLAGPTSSDPAGADRPFDRQKHSLQSPDDTLDASHDRASARTPHCQQHQQMYDTGGQAPSSSTGDDEDGRAG